MNEKIKKGHIGIVEKSTGSIGSTIEAIWDLMKKKICGVGVVGISEGQLILEWNAFFDFGTTSD